jgi:hypothetical protein
MNREELYIMPHPESKKRKRMSVRNRAAQFAPFSALTGYDEEIIEAERTTEPTVSLAEDLCEEIYRNLQKLFFATPLPCHGKITYFVPDLFKSGGRYVTVNGEITAVDPTLRTVTVENIKIPVDVITEILLS